MRYYFLVSNIYNLDTYIRNFHIKYGQIIINYANHKSIAIQYTKENLKRVLEKIKLQIYAYAQHINNKMYYEPGLKKAALSTIGSILIDGAVIGSGLLSFPVAMPIGALLTVYHLYQNYCEDDLELNNCFLQNEEEIAKRFTKNYIHYLSVLSPKARKHFNEKIQNLPKDIEHYIDINDLAFMSAGDIKTIINHTK